METEKGPGGRSFVAGAFGGVVAVVAMAVLAAMLMRRLGPRIVPRMMERMRACCDSEEMRACMEKCGCAKAEVGGGVDGAAEAKESIVDH
jgi:hypothetical protein